MSHHTDLDENIEGADKFQDWKKMSWTPTSMRRFQREMRLRPYTRRNWLWLRGLLLIQSRITSYHMFPPFEDT